MSVVARNYFNNTKIINKISEIEDLMSKIQINEFGKRKSDIVTYLDFNASNKALLSEPISQFEVVVMDAIYTLNLNGKILFTSEMVANVIAGKEVGKDKNSSMRFKMIDEAIMRLSCIRVSIDCSENLKKYLAKVPDLEARHNDYVLPIEFLTIKSRIKKIDKTIYHLKDVPILYLYAEAMGRIVSVPTELMSIPNTREDVLFSVLKREIVKTIAIMKNKKNNYSSRVISYEWKDGEEVRGLFDRIGIKKDDYANDSQWRKKKSKINTMIAQILDHLVNEQYIDGYDFNKKSGSITGVFIDIQDSKKTKTKGEEVGTQKCEEMGTI